MKEQIGYAPLDQGLILRLKARSTRGLSRAKSLDILGRFFEVGCGRGLVIGALIGIKLSFLNLWTGDYRIGHEKHPFSSKNNKKT